VDKIEANKPGEPVVSVGCSDARLETFSHTRRPAHEIGDKGNKLEMGIVLVEIGVAHRYTLLKAQEGNTTLVRGHAFLENPGRETKLVETLLLIGIHVGILLLSVRHAPLPGEFILLIENMGNVMCLLVLVVPGQHECLALYGNRLSREKIVDDKEAVLAVNTFKVIGKKFLVRLVTVEDNGQEETPLHYVVQNATHLLLRMAREALVGRSGVDGRIYLWNFKHCEVLGTRRIVQDCLQDPWHFGCKA